MLNSIFSDTVSNKYLDCYSIRFRVTVPNTAGRHGESELVVDTKCTEPNLDNLKFKILQSEFKIHLNFKSNKFHVEFAPNGARYPTAYHYLIIIKIIN